jgi:hypothetical protein
MFLVYSRVENRPFVSCPRCGCLADGELPPQGDLDGAEDYDEDGPDVQVVLASAY